MSEDVVMGAARVAWAIGLGGGSEGVRRAQWYGHAQLVLYGRLWTWIGSRAMGILA